MLAGEAALEATDRNVRMSLLDSFYNFIYFRFILLG